MAGLSVPLVGQAPEYRPPPPPSEHYSIEIRLRYLLAPDVSFSGFGSVPFSKAGAEGTNPLVGTERSIQYDDGSLEQDYVTESLVEGGAENGQRVPSPNTEATSNFTYFNEGQVDPDDPGALLFHRYAAAGDPEAEYSADVDGSMGWEINYTKYLRWNRNVGLQVGFSFNGFDSRFNDTVSADLYVQEFRHQMADGAQVPDLPEAEETTDGESFQAPYDGPETRDEGESGNLLEWAASEEVEEVIAAGATVDTEADLRSSVYNLRAGPVYSMKIGEGLGKGLGLRLGAGISAIYFNGDFSTYQILQNSGEGENPSRGLLTTNEAEWQVGGYVDASAEYSFSRRLRFFSGMQLQSGSNYEQSNNETHAEVDFRSQIYVHAGFGIRF